MCGRVLVVWEDSSGGRVVLTQKIEIFYKDKTSTKHEPHRPSSSSARGQGQQ